MQHDQIARSPVTLIKKGYNWTDVPIITFYVCDWSNLRGVQSHLYKRL